MLIFDIVAGLPCITRLLTGRVATFQTLLFARTLPVVFLHWLFIELKITIVRALILQSENPMNTIPNTLRTVQKQNRAQPHGKNWCGCLKRDLPLTKTLLHKAAVTDIFQSSEPLLTFNISFGSFKFSKTSWFTLTDAHVAV